MRVLLGREWVIAVNRFVFVLMCIMLASGFAFADVQVSGTSVSPSTLRPGTTGSISFTLTNTGAYSISGLTLSPSGYGFELFSDQVSIGTIGAAGSTPANIQFKVSPTLDSGVYNMMIAAYWNEQSASGGTGYKLIQIPVTVSKQTIFQVYSEQMTVGIGDDFELKAKIKNGGGKVTNVVLALSSTYFIAKDSSKLVIGDIGQDGTVELNVPISTNPSMPSGVYSVPVTISYQNELGAVTETTASLGTVQAIKGSVDFTVTANADSQVSPGRKVNLALNIKNDGTLAANSVKCTLSSGTASFTPLGSAQRMLGEIKPGTALTANFELGISASSTPGYYPIVATIEYLNRQGETQTAIAKTIGIEVVGIPKLSIIASTSPSPVAPGGKYSLNVQVSNIGTTDVKSLTVDLSGNENVFKILENSPADFIGNLKTDDYSQVSYNVYIPNDLAPGQYPVKVNMKFMDTYNNEQEVSETTTLQVVSAEVAAIAGNGKGGGMDISTMVILLLIVAAVGYFVVYKRFIKKNGNGKK
jgi:hypothetical protein